MNRLSITDGPETWVVERSPDDSEAWVIVEENGAVCNRPTHRHWENVLLNHYAAAVALSRRLQVERGNEATRRRQVEDERDALALEVAETYKDTARLDAFDALCNDLGGAGRAFRDALRVYGQGGTPYLTIRALLDAATTR